MSKSICINCKKHKDNYCSDLKADLGKEITVRCLGYEYKKTNFDLITQDVNLLSDFIVNLCKNCCDDLLICNVCDFNNTDNCKYSDYKLCKKGIKIYLESEVSTNE